MKFKKGDKVISVSSKTAKKGTVDVVECAPGMPVYDRNLFLDAPRGFVLKNNLWEYQHNWKLAPKRKASIKKVVKRKKVVSKKYK